MNYLVGVAIVLGVILWIWAKGAHQSYRAHVRHHGLIPVWWRWFSGRQHHGITETKKKYKLVYDPAHSGYLLKIRLHKAAQRVGWTLGPPAFAFAWIAQAATPMFWVLPMFFAIVLLAEFGIRMHGKWERQEVNKVVIRPLSRTLAPIVGLPVNTRPNTWLRVAPDRQHARVDFPKGYHPGEAERNRVATIIKEKVGMAGDAIATWNFKDNDSHVELRSANPPPTDVALADIQRDIDKAGQDRLVLGLGRGGEPVSVSLAEDSPHFGLSIAAGGGKSRLARLAAAQVLHNGGVVLILDIKRLSHAWARDLPNVRYARTVEEIHDALLWLHYEVNRRTVVADVGVDIEGEVLANVGARLLVIGEELNETTARLRRFWAETRTREQPRKSPAIEALEEVLFMGRQLRINMLAVAQMMTALAAGSGAARENMGIRILGRYTRNAWRMLVPEHDMPPRSMKPGRVQVVTSKVQECQVADLSGSEARELAVSGTVTPFPVPPVGAIESGKNVVVVPTTTAEIITEEPELITLPEAVSICPGKNLKSLQNSRLRDPNFPKSVGRRDGTRGAPNLYRTEEIRRWARGGN